MNLVGKKVKHAKYGKGAIKDHTGTYVIIKFETEAELKKFIYPTSFGTFLTLLDTDVAKHVKRTCKALEKEKIKEKAQLQKEVNTRIINQKFQTASISSKSISINQFSSVDDFCELSETAISSEITYLRANDRKRYRIFDGERIETGDRHYVYSFETDSELFLPDGTQIVLWNTRESTTAVVIACEGYNIIFSTKENLGASIPTLEFSAEPWQLLGSLNERLKEIKENPSPIVKSLVCDGVKAIDQNGETNKGQELARVLATSQPITFIWGPPGTGKTQTLASIALEHIRCGNRVLMLSYSNVSVDGAITRVHDIASRKIPGQLIRYGYPRQSSLLTHEYLTSFNLAIRNHPELSEERDKLKDERKDLDKNSVRYIEITRRLSQIKDALIEEEKEIMQKARFVATTVSKATADKALYMQKFDVVIFDEASMAYIPQIVFAASLATKHFICLGDFLQLPPIVQSSNTSFLNADIFQYCGITMAVDNGWKHNWMCLLDVQHRMHPQIADFVGLHMYHGLLKSDRKIAKERNLIASLAPISGLALGLADLSGMMSVCTKTHDKSRINVLSALISCSLAINAASKSNVGIITPYNAQSRLMLAMARDIAGQMPKLCPISCATVHQFQGSEKDVIIYDAVDCYRMRYPGTLLTSTNNNYANRLFNVAMTRARGKFIAVTNTAYMENKNISQDLLFGKLISYLKASNMYIQGQAILRPQTISKNRCLNFYEPKDADKTFLADINNSKKEVRIDIPGHINASEEFIELLCQSIEKAKSKGAKVFIRAKDKLQLPPSLRSFTIENNYLANSVAIIDKEVIWFGEPSSNEHFISEGSIIKTRFRPVIRFTGKYTAKALYGFLELNRTVNQTIITDVQLNNPNDNFASYVVNHKTCPQCGKPMKLRKNKNSKFFLGCMAYPKCKSTELINPDFVNDYLHKHRKNDIRCPHDNTSLEAKLGPFGVYIKCCGLTRHTFRLDEI